MESKMTINEKLINLYSRHWDALLLKLDGEKKETYTNPLLISIDEEKYINSEIKVMIFGQETRDWWDKDGFARDIRKGMDRYKGFYWDQKFYAGYKKSAFWKGFRFFQNALNENYKERHMTYIWNNISKIGKCHKKTGVTPRIREIEQEVFPVVKFEVEIIKPDIVIFLTGPNRDGDIKFHFPDAEFLKSNSDSTKRQLAKINSTKLPSLSIRTYHPAFYKGFNKILKNNAINSLI
jgi:hypothetical protein